MKLWAVVPVKPFDEGKSRLAGVLSTKRREAVSKRLFFHVMAVIQEAAICDAVLVVSRGKEVLAAAEQVGAIALREKPALDGSDLLNLALTDARTYAVRHHADALLVVPADLPLIVPDDLRGLRKVAFGDPDVEGAVVKNQKIVIAPSRDGGTNALLLYPPSVIDFAFGKDSFRRHCDQARLANVPCHFFENVNLATDIDYPENLEPIRDWL